VASIEFTLKNAKSISFEIVDGSGKTLWASGPEWFGSGEHQRQLPVGDLPGGTYGVVMTGGKERVGKLLVKG
jgi:hypothetical protein